MIFIVALLTFYLAWNLGANDVANSMGTSVGSKAVTLKQALVIAGVLEFAGAVLFGRAVSETLATKIVQPAIFATTPQLLLVGMVAVLLASGLWLQIATALSLPVASSHAVVGAMAGFGWAAIGVEAIDWLSIGRITIAWIVTPLLSGTIAALFYSLIKHWILEQKYPLTQLNEWIPWLSAALLSIFGALVLPTLCQPLYIWLKQDLDLTIPAHTLPLTLGASATIALTFYNWHQLKTQSTPHPSPLIPHSSLVEPHLARFQLLSACFVAFAHGSNDVGHAIAPLAVIAYIARTGSVPLYGINIPTWVLVIGGAGIVTGLGIWGKKVIATIGEGIIPLQPSGGFCAELATASTILLASHLGIPVSTTHTLVGSVIGIGIVQNWKSIQFKSIQNIALAWLITIPICMFLAASIFYLLQLLRIFLLMANG